MRRINPLLVLPAFAALLVGAAPAGAAGPIAVVDIIQVIKAHPKYPELEQGFQQRGKAAQDHAQAENAKLEGLRGRIELMNENDPGRRNMEKEFLASTNALKFEMEWRQQDAQREWMRGLEVVYSETQRLVANFARSQGIQIVLVKNERELNAGDFQDWALKVQLRAAVYADPSLDITAAVLKTIPPRAGTPPPGPGPAPVAPPANAPPVNPPGRSSVPPANPPGVPQPPK